MADLEPIKTVIKSIQESGHGSNGESILVPTRNGCHLLVPALDMKMFESKFPHVGIKKDADTLLYCP